MDSLAQAIALVVLSLQPAALRPSEPRRAFAKANKEEIHAYVMLIRLRGDLYGKWKATGKWPDDADANRALEEHSHYWAAQLRDGRAILAGGMNGDYWDNVALIIFEAASQGEAEGIVAQDPAVKAFVFQAQVRPFDIHFLTNKFSRE
jgi:uncharacterized protein YciI